MQSPYTKKIHSTGTISSESHGSKMTVGKNPLKNKERSESRRRCTYTYVQVRDSISTQKQGYYFNMMDVQLYFTLLNQSYCHDLLEIKCEIFRLKYNYRMIDLFPKIYHNHFN